MDKERYTELLRRQEEVERKIMDFLDSNINHNTQWPKFYQGIKDGDYVYFFGPTTGLVIFPSPADEKNLGYCWLKEEDDYWSLRSWRYPNSISTTEFGEYWKVVEWMEAEKTLLDAAWDYLKRFGTLKKGQVKFGGTIKDTYTLPWTNSDKQNYNG